MNLNHGWRLGAIVLLAGLMAAAGYAQNANAPYMNPALPMEQRVDDLIARMTLEEKASQLVNQSRAIPRLNVPAYDWWSEALHGVANSGIATVFPQAIGMGATWDTPLLHEVAVVISTEGRAKHHEAVRQGRTDIFEGLTFWSPNINIFRDPRWGRGQETYGEDPFLTGRMGVAFVTGMQGDDPKYYRVIATPKHYAVHSGPEPMRHFFDVDVSKHDMEDTYLPAFRASVTDGKAGSVMCVYNSVKGQPGCANTFLLQDTLRGKWGFQGYVVSDCGAVEDIQNGHHYVNTMAEAAAVSLKAGTDNECADFAARNKDNSDYVKYIDAVKQGLLSQADLDVSLRRLFMARFKLGQFDPPEMVKYAQISISENDTEAHRQLALKAARKTMVLLKNDGVLPLSATAKKILVVGPLADQIDVLEGNYNGKPSRATTALDGIKKQFPDAKVSFEPGTDFLRSAIAHCGRVPHHSRRQARTESRVLRRQGIKRRRDSDTRRPQRRLWLGLAPRRAGRRNGVLGTLDWLPYTNPIWQVHNWSRWPCRSPVHRWQADCRRSGIACPSTHDRRVSGREGQEVRHQDRADTGHGNYDQAGLGSAVGRPQGRCRSRRQTG